MKRNVPDDETIISLILLVMSLGLVVGFIQSDEVWPFGEVNSDGNIC